MDAFDKLRAASNAQQIPAGFNAEDTTNIEEIEMQFAVKAVEHMETYWSLLEKIKGSSLRMTKLDDEIYEHLKTDFPELDVSKTIDEDEMKSKRGKERWRNFMMQYEKKVKDFNFGTMLRADSKTEYTQEGTIFVPRMQFYAIEIARNKEGLNDWIFEEAQKEKEAKSS
ncbi:polysaccharide biosynthesis-domain-containing protein [Pseudomassariella vexata]|uniref:Protein PBDC1 homolog n=1 Tax=Pseudomassariella vexata TaxID=1141098 RepID=A0A1Y2DFA1_9PEZI|nr:polysaccharide biosynthesis-domain-containing protein [Pseudomassariella vexata]ORY57784.1 polysaccharide biosynthesis-domain-containing protein [Pseudomassariella vexata]